MSDTFRTTLSFGTEGSPRKAFATIDFNKSVNLTTKNASFPESPRFIQSNDVKIIDQQAI